MTARSLWKAFPVPAGRDRTASVAVETPLSDDAYGSTAYGWTT
jgi:hypothetical protein